MDNKGWIDIYPYFFYGQKNYSYNQGKPANYLGVKVVECSESKTQLSYGRYYEGELVAIIMRYKNLLSINQDIDNFIYCATVKSLEGYSYDSFYSNSISDLKLKSDLHLIKQGVKINFPGV